MRAPASRMQLNVPRSNRTLQKMRHNCVPVTVTFESLEKTKYF